RAARGACRFGFCVARLIRPRGEHAVRGNSRTHQADGHRDEHEFHGRILSSFFQIERWGNHIALEMRDSPQTATTHSLLELLFPFARPEAHATSAGPARGLQTPCSLD